MGDLAGFIGKILLLSAGLSFTIKYGGRLLAVNPTNGLALAIVFLPSLIMAIILGWRSKKL